jgi:ElaB/YqjD/DUF883 family membrane-anchored ribosome-binding protein
MNHRTETHTDSPEQLIKNIQQLMDEVEAIVAKSADVGEAVDGRLGDLQERLSSAKDKVQDYYKVAKRKISDGARATDDAIRSHPYESLAVALGVGLLLGALIRRRS